VVLVATYLSPIITPLKERIMKVLPTSPIEALGGAHQALLEDLRMLETAAAQCSNQNAVEMKARLDQIHQHLKDHFQLEEQDGYMDAVLKRDPHRERTVAELLQEHHEMGETLEVLVKEAGAATGLDKSFGDRVRTWIHRVRDHESRENLLVQEVFNMDIAAED
jgi:DUF1680 family protein